MSAGNVCPQEVELPLAVQEFGAMKRLLGLFTVIGYVTAGKHNAKFAGREKNNAIDLSSIWNYRPGPSDFRCSG
jgi:hypothetical protein